MLRHGVGPVVSVFALIGQQLVQVHCQDDVVRGSDQSEPTSSDQEEDTNSSVVVLGVTLSLSVIFAIAGIFIGLYFHVERALCCCRARNEEGEGSKLESGDSPWYTNSTNVFMAGTANRSFSQSDEGLNTEEETNNKSQKSGSDSTARPKKAPRRPPLIAAKRGRKKKSRQTPLTSDNPVGFVAASSQVTSDGTIVRSPIEESVFDDVAYDVSSTAKPFSTQQDDILF